jgi:hypothetical protein
LHLWRSFRREYLAAQVENRQRAWNANSFARRDDGEVPAADQTKESETSSNVQQFRNVFQICCRRGGRNREICCCNESKEHHKTEECESEEQIDADGADEEDKACDDPMS